MTMPIHDYQNAGSRCSITGAAVYRSCEVPAWDGVYFFADYCSGEVFGLVWDGASVMDLGPVTSSNGGIMGSGWNAWGDVYFTTIDNQITEEGSIWRVAPQ